MPSIKFNLLVIAHRSLDFFLSQWLYLLYTPAYSLYSTDFISVPLNFPNSFFLQRFFLFLVWGESFPQMSTSQKPTQEDLKQLKCPRKWKHKWGIFMQWNTIVTLSEWELHFFKVFESHKYNVEWEKASYTSIEYSAFYVKAKRSYMWVLSVT